MPPKYLSPTALNTYLRCPRKYFLKYILRLKEKPNIYLYRGLAVHQALARFHSLELTAFKSHSDMQAALVGIFKENWRRQAGAIAALGLPPGKVDRFYEESQTMLRAWIPRYTASPISGLASPRTEVKLFSRQHGVMGVIDAVHLVDGQVALVDYKTSARDEITPEIEVQMAVYALLYEDCFNVRPDIVAIDFLKTGTEKRFPVTENLIEKAKRLCWETRALTSSDKEEDYPCTCGGWCARDFVNQDGGHQGNLEETEAVYRQKGGQPVGPVQFRGL